jgi:hypothetical protein
VSHHTPAAVSNTRNKYNGADLFSHHHGHQFHRIGSCCPTPLATTTRSSHTRLLGTSNPCSMSGSTVNTSLHRVTAATRYKHQICLYFTKGTNIFCNILLKMKTLITWCSHEGKETAYMNDTSLESK